jgi:formate dehydrogenase major subunit
MTIVNITINGQKIEAQAGETVLEAATANGINIPTLCHHPALAPQGSCRMCLVEVEKQRGLQPACTFPITEGMVVSTHTPKTESARRFVLELLFSERIHYCMYCPMSGDEDSTDCELQSLAYRYGLTSWDYPPNTTRRWPVDASRKYFVMDHSRCILCRRCIRACDEIAANHTLGVRDRGARTMIIADTDVPFGESSCVSCGTCLQVCPVGALMDRRSAYMGHHSDADQVAATCLGCSVGCGINAVVRSNQLLRVESDWQAANAGLLCVDGRFAVVEPQPERLTTPLVRRDGQLVPVSWDEALNTIASRLTAAGPVAGLASPRATNEELAAFQGLLTGALHSDAAHLLYGDLPISLGTAGTFADLMAADYIVVAGGQPLADQKVVGYTIKRTVEQGATLILVGDTLNDLDPFARQRLPLAQAAELATVLSPAQRPVVLYAAGLPAATYDALAELPRARFLPLYTGTNAAGAAQAGLRTGPVSGAALYVLACDEVPQDGRALPQAAFTVVQSAYRTAWTAAADVVLPAQTWSEKAGHIVNLESRELNVVPFIKAPQDVPADGATLALLAQRLGYALN